MLAHCAHLTSPCTGPKTLCNACGVKFYRTTKRSKKVSGGGAGAVARAAKVGDVPPPLGTSSCAVTAVPLECFSLCPLVVGAPSGPRQPLHPSRRAASLFHHRRLRRRDVRRADVRRGRWRERRRRLRPGRRRRRGRQRGVRGAHRGAELAVLCAAGERRARQQWLRQLPPRQQRH